MAKAEIPFDKAYQNPGTKYHRIQLLLLLGMVREPEAGEVFACYSAEHVFGGGARDNKNSKTCRAFASCPIPEQMAHVNFHNLHKETILSTTTSSILHRKKWTVLNIQELPGHAPYRKERN